MRHWFPKGGLDAKGKYIILVAEDGRDPPSQNVLRK